MIICYVSDDYICGRPIAVCETSDLFDARVTHLAIIHPVSKTRLLTFDHNFVKCRPPSKFFHWQIPKENCSCTSTTVEDGDVIITDSQWK